MPGTTIIIHSTTTLSGADIPASSLVVMILAAVLVNLVALWAGQKMANS